jgi:hypothetical protein
MESRDPRERLIALLLEVAMAGKVITMPPPPPCILH